MAFTLKRKRMIRWPGALLAVMSVSGWLYFAPVLAAASDLRKRGGTRAPFWSTVVVLALPLVWTIGLALSSLCLLKPRLRTASTWVAFIICLASLLLIFIGWCLS